MPQGHYGVIRNWWDGGSVPDAWGTGVGTLGGGWSYGSVNEGSFSRIVDESGQITRITLDTADNDNIALFSGPFLPSAGGCEIEVRFKSIILAETDVFLGFTETFVVATPVVPITFTTATMGYASQTGGVAGFVDDALASTRGFRAHVADGGAATSGSDTNGTISTQGAAVADEFDILRVEMGPDGEVRMYHDDVLIKTVANTGSINTADLFVATLMFQNAGSNASDVEVDYLHSKGYREWAV